jgi:hypothetical protein
MSDPTTPTTEPDPYARSTRFRCAQGHGVWRRDELPVRRGSIVCPVGLRGACICGLKMEPAT